VNSPAWRALASPEIVLADRNLGCDRQCPRARENFIVRLGTKSAPAGFPFLQIHFRLQFGLNDLRAEELRVHDRQFSRGALAGYTPPTENGGLQLARLLVN
jgi:hypothetical protein